MTQYKDTFTQGGQTQLHKFHMIRQVIESTFKIGMGIFFVSFVIYIYSNHCWQDFWYLLCYLKAWVRLEYLDILPNGLFDETWIKDSFDVVHIISDFSLLNTQYYHHLMKVRLLSLSKGLLYSLLISIIGYIALSWFWVKRGRQKQTAKIVSGFECVTPKVLRGRILKSGASSYTISDVPMPKGAEYQHMMVTGTTGAGKSNMIHQLLSQIRANGDQAIVVDTTGGIFSRFFDIDRDVLFNPLDKRSKNWNMWAEITNDHVLDEIAESIIPDSRLMDSFWTQGARQLFMESIKFLKNHDHLVYDQLINMTLRMPLKELHQHIGHTSAASLLDPSIDKTALSVRASLSNHMRIFSSLKDDTSGISLLDFMKNNTKDWVFLSCPTDQRAYLKSIFSVWLSLVIKGMMTRSENNGSRTWIIIDELASLNKLPSLMTGLAEIRKYGGCFVLGFQDLNQVEDIYGIATAKTLSNLTGTKVLFRAIDSDVAFRVSRYMGEQEKEELSTSISYGAHEMRDGVNLNQQRQVKPVIRSSDIMLLNDLEAYVKFPGQFPIAKIKFDYMNVPCVNEIHQERAMHVQNAVSQLNKNTKKNITDEDEASSNIIAVTFNKNNKLHSDAISAHKKTEEDEMIFEF